MEGAVLSKKDRESLIATPGGQEYEICAIKDSRTCRPLIYSLFPDDILLAEHFVER